jgi:hypothetical protein
MGTIADKLLYLGETKAALRTAINAAGGGLLIEDQFRNYVPDWLREQSATLSLDFLTQRYVVRDKVTMFPTTVSLANTVTWTRSTGGGKYNEAGFYEYVPALKSNLTTNSVFAGATGGTPGTAPTGYSLLGAGVPVALVAGRDSSHIALRISTTANRCYLERAYTVVANTVYIYSFSFTGSGGAALNQACLVLGPAGTTSEYLVNGVSALGTTVPASGVEIRVGVIITITTAGSMTIRTGNGTSGDATDVITVGAPQLEIGNTAGEYVATESVTFSAVANTPRIDYDPITKVCKGVLIEEQRTNLVTLQPPAAGWGAGIKTLVVGPDGRAGSAVKVTQNGTGTEFYNQVISASGASDTTVSVHIKKDGTALCRVSAGFINPSATGKSVVDGIFTASTGLFSNVAPTEADYTITDLGDYWRLSILLAASAASTQIQLYIEHGTNKVPGTFNTFWGFQIEVGTFVTSYIPTTTAAVTRGRDTGNAANGASGSKGTILAVLSGNRSGTSVTAIAGVGTVSTSRWGLYTKNIAFRAILFNNGAGSVTGALTTDPLARNKLAASFDAATGVVKVCNSGSAITTGANFTAVSSNALILGTSTSNEHIGQCHLEQIQFYPEAFGDLALQEITSPTVWNPYDLFAQSEQGAWYDPSDVSTLFQDAAGTIPVTAIGQPVGRMLDKSRNGNHAIQTVSASRPTYQTDGTKRWLAFDGVDDTMATVNTFTIKQEISISVALSRLNDIGGTTSVFGLGTASLPRFQVYGEASGRMGAYARLTAGTVAGSGIGPVGNAPADGTPFALHALLTSTEVVCIRSTGTDTRAAIGAVNGINEPNQKIAINATTANSILFYGGFVLLDANIEAQGKSAVVLNYLKAKGGVI